MIGVKGIFKTLVGTILVICFGSLFIEYINITASTTFMNGMMSRSVEKSCDYFAQETYKNNDIGLTGNTSAITDENGQVYCSGSFYTGNKEDVYKHLYGSGSAFADWYRTTYNIKMKNSAGVSSNQPMWTNLECLANGLHISNVGLKASEKRLGESYVDNMMSPLNLGIPYLDEDTVTKIARWNLAYNLSEGFKSRIHINDIDKVTDEPLDPYIAYHGFRIYTNDLKISTSDYKVYDIRTASGREQFTKDTNMDATQLYGGENDSASIINTLDERAYIGVVNITYTVPMEYEGVTPMRNMLNYVQNRTASIGYGSMTGQRNAMQDWGYNGKAGSAEYKSNAFTQKMAIQNKLVYYIVR